MLIYLIKILKPFIIIINIITKKMDIATKPDENFYWYFSSIFLDPFQSNIQYTQWNSNGKNTLKH